MHIQHNPSLKMWQTVARNLTAAFLADHLPGSQVIEGAGIPGLLHFRFWSPGNRGYALSINAFTGDAVDNSLLRKIKLPRRSIIL